MIARKIERLLRQRLREYPSVALVGARQTGKTTLARSLSGDYFDLELDADRLRLDLTWNEATRSARLLVLDEAQTWPEIFPRLRSAIDRNRRRNGRFLLLGSVSPAMMKHVSESLAGRMALCELTPFLLSEAGVDRADDLWLRGGYPDGGILSRSRFPAWQQNYLSLLAQRDLPNWGLPAKASFTERLFKRSGAPFSRRAKYPGYSPSTERVIGEWSRHARLRRRRTTANHGCPLVRSPSRN